MSEFVRASCSVMVLRRTEFVGSGPFGALRLAQSVQSEGVIVVDVIIVGRVAHMSTEAVEAMCLGRRGVEEITDECAVTIASFWQAPGTTGKAFAQLASTGTVDCDELLSDIHDAWLSAGNLPASEVLATRLQLDMLATWAMDKTREG